MYVHSRQVYVGSTESRNVEFCSCALGLPALCSASVWTLSICRIAMF